MSYSKMILHVIIVVLLTSPAVFGATASSVTFQSATTTNQITFTFNQSYEVGQFANGDWWVVGPVTITNISPGWDGDGNGFDVNPVRQLTGAASSAEQGWGQTFDSKLQQFGSARSLPYTAQAGETVISTIKNREGGDCGINLKPKVFCIKYAAALTVVSSAVSDPATAFRPPYCGKWDTQNYEYLTPNKPIYRTTDIRWDRFPMLDSSGITDLHSINAIKNMYANLHLDYVEHNQAQEVRPLDAFSGVGSQNYGGHYGFATASHLLRMTLDDFDPVNDVNARQAAINFIQLGIDYYHLAVDADRVHHGHGGHGPGALSPIFAAAWLLDDEDMLDWLESTESETFIAEKQVIFRSSRSVTYADGGPLPDEMEEFENNQPVLYGERWGNPRKYGDSYVGVKDCETWTSNNMSGLCRDPHEYIDGPAAICNWPITREAKNYEKMNYGPIKASALAIRLFGGNWQEGWEYAVRRTYHGYWMKPDLAYLEGFIGNSQPTGPRCQGQHGAYANSNATNATYYPGDGTTNATQLEQIWSAHFDAAVNPPPADTTAPSTPTGLAYSNVMETSVDLDWNASSDNVGVAGYKVYTDGSNPFIVGVTAVTVAGLDSNTEYTFTVSAFDAADNESSESSGVTVTTDAVASTVEAPVFDPTGGSYTAALSVSISTGTSGATIRYTTDGSTPTSSSGTVYSSPVSITASTTLKAIAYKSGMADSLVTVADYELPDGSVTGESGDGFHNTSISPALSGMFTVIFDAVPSGDPTHGLIGLADGSPSLAADLALNVKFDQYGNIVARDGGSYSADNTIDYSADILYAFRILVDVDSHTYSSYVSEDGGAEIAIGEDYDFRTGHGSVTSLDTWGLMVVDPPSGVSVTVSNFDLEDSQVDTPEIDPAGGSFTSAQSVTIATDTAGASIRYTTNGSTPTSSTGTLYTGSFNVSSSSTVKAIAYKSGMEDSEIGEAIFTITSVVDDPIATPAGSTYGDTVEVALSSGTEGASIRYTTNGSTPTSGSGTVYSGPITVSSTTTIKAIAYKSGMTDSSVVTEVYTITASAVANPQASPGPGTYSGSVTITLTSATPGASIRYTLNGTTPSAPYGGKSYTGPFEITSDKTLKAIAFKDGMDDSDVVIIGDYDIQ